MVTSQCFGVDFSMARAANKMARKVPQPVGLCGPSENRAEWTGTCVTAALGERFSPGGTLMLCIRQISNGSGPELRDLWSSVPTLNVTTNQSWQHNLFVGAGPVWHF